MRLAIAIAFAIAGQAELAFEVEGEKKGLNISG